MHFDCSLQEVLHKAQNKGATLYIEGRKKTTGNIAGFINSTQPKSTLNKPNCMFKSREGNHVFVCSTKSIVASEEMLINYNLNCADTNMVSMVVIHPTIYPTFY